MQEHCGACREYFSKIGEANNLLLCCTIYAFDIICNYFLYVGTGIQIVLNQVKMCVLSRLAQIFEKNRCYARPAMFNYNGCVLLDGAITLKHLMTSASSY